MDVVKVYIMIEEIKKYKVKFDLERYYVIIVENMFIGVMIFVVCVVLGVKCEKFEE